MFESPLRIEATGPFRTNDGKLPSVDLELKIGTDGGGQTVTTGFLSTGDRAFVKFQDVYYEQPPSEVRRRTGPSHEGKAGAARCARWGSTRAAGSARRGRGGGGDGRCEDAHVSGTLDVEGLLRDLNRFVRKSGSAMGGPPAGRRPSR